MRPQKLLIKVVKILENLEIPYLISGGIAVSVWGRPRATFDIDIVIEVSKSQILSLVEALRELSEAGYIDKQAAKKALKTKGEFNFIEPDSDLKVDFWVWQDTPFSKNEFKRGVYKKIDGTKICFISPEDLVLRKLQWYKKGQISKHLEDAESILKFSDIDLEYIKKWAKKQSTLEILSALEP